MPRTELSALPDDARIWIFGISPRLDDASAATLLQQADSFLEQWSAHGAPITAGRAIVDHTFLVIGVDQRSETSGCSIDRMFGLFRHLEQSLGVQILDSNRIFFRHGSGEIDSMSRADFSAKADGHTIVFDTTAERLGEIRQGQWERPAGQSWHRELLPA